MWILKWMANYTHHNVKCAMEIEMCVFGVHPHRVLRILCGDYG